MTIVKFKKKDPSVRLPAYQTLGAAAADVFANESFELVPGVVACVSTGLFPEIPDGFEIQVRARSGMAATKTIIVPNSPGTIDSDFRGEMKILLLNLGEKTQEFKKFSKIAQLVVAPVITATFEETEVLTKTERGEGGFGSTGK